MISMSILDPTKVTRSSLQYAVFIANLMITTECMITDLQYYKVDLKSSNKRNNIT